MKFYLNIYDNFVTIYLFEYEILKYSVIYVVNILKNNICSVIIINYVELII